MCFISFSRSNFLLFVPAESGRLMWTGQETHWGATRPSIENCSNNVSTVTASKRSMNWTWTMYIKTCSVSWNFSSLQWKRDEINKTTKNLCNFKLLVIGNTCQMSNHLIWMFCFEWWPLFILYALAYIWPLFSSMQSACKFIVQLVNVSITLITLWSHTTESSNQPQLKSLPTSNRFPYW